MKNSKRMLNGQPCYIVDELTQQDLKEKRKWLPNIKTLYENGTKLRFSVGKWRTTQGTPYLFDKKQYHCITISLISEIDNVSLYILVLSMT